MPQLREDVALALFGGGHHMGETVDWEEFSMIFPRENMGEIHWKLSFSPFFLMCFFWEQLVDLMKFMGFNSEKIVQWNHVQHGNGSIRFGKLVPISVRLGARFGS